MKKIIVLSIAVLGIAALSFKMSMDKTAATVTSEQGLSIFIYSKPKQAYDYLGTVKTKVSWSGKADELLKQAIKKVKKEYPQAEAIIFASIDMDVYDAIKFKE